jgi:hypothetical protein
MENQLLLVWSLELLPLHNSPSVFFRARARNRNREGTQPDTLGILTKKEIADQGESRNKSEMNVGRELEQYRS